MTCPGLKHAGFQAACLIPEPYIYCKVLHSCTLQIAWYASERARTHAVAHAVAERRVPQRLHNTAPHQRSLMAPEPHTNKEYSSLWMCRACINTVCLMVNRIEII